MKNYAYLFLLVIFGCFLFACDNSLKSEDEATRETTTEEGPKIASDYPLVPRVLMQLELINNTGGDVTIVEPFYVSTDQTTDSKYGFIAFLPARESRSYTTAGNAIGSFVYSWSPKRHFLDKKEAKKFQPHIFSYLLGIRINGETYYLAGWPQSMGIPSAYDEENAPKYFDGGNIVQYGIGYGNNTRLVYDEYGVARTPFTVSYDTESGTTEREFVLTDHLNELIFGKAVITIDAPDKIEYRTESLFLPPDGYHADCRNWRPEYKAEFLATEEGKEHAAVCPVCLGVQALN
ncbi:hypothetical protein AGMMS50267_15180 [Spirochaetia bacterium]|nr:hypothetical protein AGMMS50267_15180 [Spirochaetia bacterium]